MSVATADVQTAVNAAWAAAGLDAHFTAYWTAAEIANNAVLSEREAAPGQPFPYCVMETDAPRTLQRMSWSSGKREFREVGVTFNIHAKLESGSGLSAKQLAAQLAEELMKVFGGHPTHAPADLTLANGGVLLTQYQSDWPQPTELYHYQWIVKYLVRVDVPVAV